MNDTLRSGSRARPPGALLPAALERAVLSKKREISDFVVMERESETLFL